MRLFQPYLFLALFLCGFANASAQTDSTQWATYFQERNLIQRRGMTVLGGWAAGNMAVGAVGSWQADGETQAIHQMNLLWNTVNMGLATMGYFRSKKPLTASNAYQATDLSYRPEKTLIFNAGLDLGYIGAGLYLIERGKQRTNLAARDQSVGFGKSLVMQGAFLFLFDVALHQALVKHRKTRLANLLR